MRSFSANKSETTGSEDCLETFCVDESSEVELDSLEVAACDAMIAKIKLNKNLEKTISCFELIELILTNKIGPNS